MNIQTPLAAASNRKPTLRENFCDFLMNSQTYFSLTKTNIPKLSSKDQIYILGQKFFLKNGIDPKTFNKTIENTLNKIIWFSYRRNFPILQSKSNKTFISDTGWGCSIRVGQMLLAELLSRHLPDGGRTEKIIGFFNDCEIDPFKSPFSIQQISIASAQLFKLEPGCWFRFTHIMIIFEELYHNFAFEIIPNLEFLLFPDGILFFNQIYEKVSPYSNCIGCREKKFDKFFREKLCEKCRKFNKSLFLLICLMPSLNYLKNEDFAFIEELMSCPYSVGLMGGKPRRAKYFVAVKDGFLISKDPHYVQDAVADKMDITSYFTNGVKYVEINKMASSLAFGFYFRNEFDFEIFEGFIRKKKEEMGEKWMLCFDEEFKEMEFKDEMRQSFAEEEEEEKNEEIDVLEENNLVIISKNNEIQENKNNEN